MITNARLKFLSSLKQKKYRWKERKFLIEGENLLKAAIVNNIAIDEIYVASDYEGEILPLLDNEKKLIKLPPSKMARFSTVKTPPGIMALLPFFRYNVDEFHNALRILYLENLSDPGNTGTLIRDARAFGFDCVFISPDGCEIYNSKLLRSTAGYIFSIPVVEDVKLAILQNYKNRGFELISANPHAEITIEEAKCPQKAVIMLGNEPRGLSEEAEGMADIKLKIGIKEDVESLNVASAGAIIMHWAKL
ncbi:MAG: RNA methyltransferase [candidate division Zixibacteria bacterium]|nr:RNA methyltransferase [candidate division Zixibacteria bacterium]